MKKLIIFGGSFDPIHVGHIQIARKAIEYFDADLVFMLSPSARWKDPTSSLDDRKEMIKLASKQVKRSSVDFYEVEHEIKYTYDTIKHYKDSFPNCELILLIGEDHVNKFPMWGKSEEIATLAKVVYYGRNDDEETDSSIIEKYHMTRLDGNFFDVSSSAIRALQCFEMPYTIIDYVVKHQMYGIRKLRTYYSEARWNHVVSVGALMYEMYVTNGLKNPGKAYLTGLFHDIAKKLTIEETSDLMVKYCYLDISVGESTYHEFLAPIILERDFGITDNEIKEACRYHCTGNENLSTLGKALYAADKIDPARGYDSREMIEGCLKNIDEGFKEVLRQNVLFLICKGVDYNNKYTLACIKQYLPGYKFPQE